MTETLPKPASREEQFLAKAAGMRGVELPTPASREELYLNAIAKGGGGGGGGDYVEKVGEISEYPFDNQKPYLIVDDRLVYDVESINVGQLVYDLGESKFYVYAGTDIDPDTGDEYIIWDEVGGTEVVITQNFGNSTSIVMSQKATSQLVYKDAYFGGGNQIQIGSGADTTGTQAVGVGSSSKSSGTASVAIGGSCQATAQNSVAFAQGQATTQGEFNVGTSYNWSSGGYNNTAYRVIRGVHDGEESHDAVTVGQINNLIDAINSATGKNISHIGS